MTNSLLTYADHEYYQLTYSNISHTLTKINDTSNMLQTIVPKAIWSETNCHCIIDIDNNINYMFVKRDDVNTVDKIFLNLGKVTLKEFTIVACTVILRSRSTSKHRILLKNKENDKPYEYIKIKIINGTMESFFSKLLDNDDVTWDGVCYNCVINCINFSNVVSINSILKQRTGTILILNEMGSPDNHL